MPEKVLRKVVNSERYQGATDHWALVQRDEQTRRLSYIAKNPKCPSDLLDKLSNDENMHVLEAVIYNKNTKVETLKSMLKRIENSPAANHEG